MTSSPDPPLAPFLSAHDPNSREAEVSACLARFGAELLNGFTGDAEDVGHVSFLLFHHLGSLINHFKAHKWLQKYLVVMPLDVHALIRSLSSFSSISHDSAIAISMYGCFVFIFFPHCSHGSGHPPFIIHAPLIHLSINLTTSAISA